MPPRPKVTKLPVEVRLELDSRLRKNNYSEYEKLSFWLATLGYKIGHSALHAYGTDLRAKDSAAVPSGRRAWLLVELGKLRLREHAILQQLSELPPEE